MQKVYLLLRDNKQSGPYSLEELVQLGLRPFDLVWVEGRSLGWSYPSEISALKPYVPEAPASVQPQGTESTPSTPPTYTTADTTTSSSPKVIPPPKSVFVSLPGKGVPPAAPKETPPASDWDRRVEELRQRAQTYTPAPGPQEETPPLNTNLARSLDEVEEQYTSWVYDQKSKKKTPLTGRRVAALATVVVLLGAGYLAATSLSETEKKTTEAPLTAQPTPREAAPITGDEPAAPTVAYESEAQPQEANIPFPATHKEVKKPASGGTAVAATHKQASPVAKPVQNPASPQPQSDNSVASTPAPQEPAAKEPQEKKKTLADKIDGFIGKIASKGRSGTQKEEGAEPPRTTPDAGTGERRSTRRGDEAIPSMDAAELARQVEVVVNNSDGWMMGVKGLKLTVRNNSPVALKNAAVEVAYYTESDNLLEKKTVQVSGVPSRGRKTVAAPDQRMADHVEVKLLSVSADDQAYAQQ